MLPPVGSCPFGWSATLPEEAPTHVGKRFVPSYRRVSLREIREVVTGAGLFAAL